MKKSSKAEKEILLNKNLHLLSQEYEKWYLKFFLVVMSFFGVFGTIFSFITSFDLQVYKFNIITFMILFITIFSIIFFKRKYTNALIIAINIMYILLYFLFKNVVIYGVVNICNVVNNKLSAIMGGMLIDLSLEGLEEVNIGFETSMDIALIFIMFIVTEAVCYSIIYKNNFILLLISTVPIIEIGLFFAVMPDILPFLMVIICWIVAFSFSIFKVSSKSKVEFKYNKRKKKYFYINEKFKKDIKIQSGIILSIVVLCLFGLVFIIYPKEKYLGNKELIKTKKEMAQYINNAEFEKMFSLFSSSASGGINGGKLGSVGSIEYDNETDLIVKADEFYNDIYLKGYIGEEYTGRSWENISLSTYNSYSNLLQGINTKNLNYEAAEQYFYNEGEIEGFIEVENVGANNKYAYAPYNAEYKSDIFNFHNDSFVSPKSNKKLYSFFYYSNSIEDVNLTYANNIFNDEYLEKEERYREYVYDVYTKLPKLTLRRVREKYGNLADGDNFSIDDKIQMAKEVINDGTSYTLSPGKLPIGKDFVDYFLLENKKGYCTHYASAATVLLRMWGVPARYVEGYMIKSDGASGNEINVKDSSAHAWVEVYIDGAGWKPVEVTPGYSDENSYVADNKSDVYNNQQIENNEEEQQNPTEEAQNNEEEIQNNEEEQKVQDEKKESIEKGGVSKNESGSKERLIFISPKYIKGILLGFLIIGVLITIIMARYVYIINKRNKLFNTKDINKNVINMYKYLKRVKNYGQSLQNGAIKEKEFDEIIKILNKAEFSNHKISQEEFEIVRNFVRSFVDKTYGELSKRKKLIFKYIQILHYGSLKNTNKKGET